MRNKFCRVFGKFQFTALRGLVLDALPKKYFESEFAAKNTSKKDITLKFRVVEVIFQSLVTFKKYIDKKKSLFKVPSS